MSVKRHQQRIQPRPARHIVSIGLVLPRVLIEFTKRRHKSTDDLCLLGLYHFPDGCCQGVGIL